MKLKSIEELLQYPYVIIYDSANGNRVHKTSCSFVTEENFNKKVKENLEQYGYYQSVYKYEDVIDKTVSPCKVCKPHIA